MQRGIMRARKMFYMDCHLPIWWQPHRPLRLPHYNTPGGPSPAVRMGRGRARRFPGVGKTLNFSVSPGKHHVSTFCFSARRRSRDATDHPSYLVFRWLIDPVST